MKLIYLLIVLNIINGGRGFFNSFDWSLINNLRSPEEKSAGEEQKLGDQWNNLSDLPNVRNTRSNYDGYYDGPMLEMEKSLNENKLPNKNLESETDNKNPTAEMPNKDSALLRAETVSKTKSRSVKSLRNLRKLGKTNKKRKTTSQKSSNGNRSGRRKSKTILADFTAEQKQPMLDKVLKNTPRSPANDESLLKQYNTDERDIQNVNNDVKIITNSKTSSSNFENPEQPNQTTTQKSILLYNSQYDGPDEQEYLSYQTVSKGSSLQMPADEQIQLEKQPNENKTSFHEYSAAEPDNVQVDAILSTMPIDQNNFIKNSSYLRHLENMSHNLKAFDYMFGETANITSDNLGEIKVKRQSPVNVLGNRNSFVQLINLSPKLTIIANVLSKLLGFAAGTQSSNNIGQTIVGDDNSFTQVADVSPNVNAILNILSSQDSAGEGGAGLGGLLGGLLGGSDEGGLLSGLLNSILSGNGGGLLGSLLGPLGLNGLLGSLLTKIVVPLLETVLGSVTGLLQAVLQILIGLLESLLGIAGDSTQQPPGGCSGGTANAQQALMIAGNNNQIISLLNIFAQLFVTFNILSDIKNGVSASGNNTSGNGNCGAVTPPTYNISPNNPNEICFQIPGGGSSGTTVLGNDNSVTEAIKVNPTVNLNLNLLSKVTNQNSAGTGTTSTVCVPISSLNSTVIQSPTNANEICFNLPMASGSSGGTTVLGDRNRILQLLNLSPTINGNVNLLSQIQNNGWLGQNSTRVCIPRSSTTTSSGGKQICLIVPVARGDGTTIMGNRNRFFQLLQLAPKINLNLNLLSSMTGSQPNGLGGSTQVICINDPLKPPTTENPDEICIDIPISAGSGNTIVGNNNRFFQLADISPTIGLNLNLLSSITNQQGSQATVSNQGSTIRICFPKPPTTTTPKPPTKRCYKKVCKKFKEVSDYKCVSCNEENYGAEGQPDDMVMVYEN